MARRHDVARRQLVDEPLAPGVAQQRPVAPERLRQQRPGHLGVVEGGGVELDELEVGHGHAGPQGHGHAVAGGLGRVGGDGVELARAARGQQRVPGPHLAAHARRVERPRRPGTGRPPRSGRGRTSSSITAAAVGLHGLHQRPLDLRRRSPRRRRAPPGHRVAALPGQRTAGRGRPGRTPRPRAIRFWTRAGPSSTSTRTASTSHRPAPAARVSARCRSVESGSPPSTAATPPWAQRVAAWSRSPLVSTPTRRPGPLPVRPPAGRRTAAAADRPATPLPSTSRSSTSASGSASVGPQAGRLSASTLTTSGSKPASSPSS